MNTIESKLMGWPGAMIAGFLLCMVLALHFKNNAATGVLGTDESLYIFLAHGQNEPCQLAQPISSLGVALEKSLRRTGDPVGFFVLLHYWQHISMNEAWLRLLPFLLYCIGIIALIGIGRLLYLPPLVSVLAGALPIGSLYLNLYAIELRGYGLEVCFAFILILCGIWIFRKWVAGKDVTALPWIALTLVAVLGFSTRVSFAITCGALYTVLWLAVIVRPQLRRYRVPLLISSIMVVVALGVMVWLIFHYATSVVNVSADEYVIIGTPLHKMRVLITELFRLPLALFSGAGIIHAPLLLKGVFICSAGCTAIIVLLLALRSMFTRKTDGASFWERYPLQVVVFFYAGVVLLFALMLALLGIHPFVAMSRWGLFMQPALYVAIVALLSIAFSSGVEQLVGRNLRLVGIVSLVVTIIMYGALYSRLIITMRGGGSHDTEKLITMLVPSDHIVSVKWWYLSKGEVFPFLYLVQYGNLKSTVSLNSACLFESFQSDTTDRAGIESLSRTAESGDTVLMLLSHISKQNRGQYQILFFQHFPTLAAVKSINSYQYGYFGIKQ